MRFRLVVVVAAFVALVVGAQSASAASKVISLTVEHRVNPLGIDAPNPRFGWQMASRQRAQKQTGYELLVASSPKLLRPGRADLWDSGKIASAESVAVRYQGKPLTASTRYFWTVRVWDRAGMLAKAPTARFETALLSTDGKEGWDGAKWITMAGKEPNSEGAPMLRRQFALEGRKVRSARLYVSALGVYDAYLNGKRVSVPQGKGRTLELLTPGWSNYDSTTNYMTYDVTRLLRKQREATLGAVLGNGWYNGRISSGSTYYSSDGHLPALKAKLLIRYADGATQSVVTEPGSWKATDTGPYVANDIYDGETYDARKELPGWNASGFDDSKWSETAEDDFLTRFPESKLVAYPGETARLMKKWDRTPQSVVLATGVTGEGKGKVVVDASRSALPVTINPGETAVIDLGQNIVGVPRYTVRGPAGAQIVFKFGEMLNDDSEGADGPEGSVYRANLRTAKATSTYILKGTESGETHQDTQSFYGFRYVSVTTDQPVTLTSFTGKVATSAIRETGSITTDDPLINRLLRNVRWGQRGNYLWIPTDCPQRDERQGWTGDTQLFSNTGLYNADATNFLDRFTDILVENQETYGTDGAQYTNVAPGGNFAGGASGWSDVGVIVPWTIWQMSGDRSVVDRNWAAMTKYMDWQVSRGGATYSGPGSTFGDWLAFQPTSNGFMSDVYFAYTARLMAQMAKGTGRQDDAAKYDALFGNIKQRFVQRYLGSDPRFGTTLRSSLGQPDPVGLAIQTAIIGGTPAPPEDDTQTGLLWVLKLGLYDTKEQRQDLVKLLAQNIENDGTYPQTHPSSTRRDQPPNTLSVGFLGINVLAPVLTAEGRTDLAYKLLHQDAMPSWLYSVKNGATTVWERWNSYSKEDGFGPVAMNSFNHYSYGAIAEWMYSDMAGIARDPAHPGFKRFVLQPHLDPTGKITRVAGRFDSPYGRIVSRWRLDGNTLHYHAVVPANTTAVLRLPGQDGVTTRRLASGAYDITSTVATGVPGT
jgi:alpha-L-rhamnosidase